ncbi:MAG: hypothetical protein LUE13_08775 [Akkermansiaceae bacterium]|nr:hypothetical protein [Akkermansiaceae bacterium]
MLDDKPAARILLAESQFAFTSSNISDLLGDIFIHALSAPSPFSGSNIPYPSFSRTNPVTNQY